MKRLIILLSILAISNVNKKYCDIKGNVLNPGVYEIKNNYTIQDIINDAGGLKNNSFTDNINLSKKVSDEMVIFINTKDEINRIKRLNECDCSPKYIYIECEEKTNSTIDYDFSTTKPISFNSTKTTKTTTKQIIDNTSLTTAKNKETTTKENKTETVEASEQVEEVINDNKLININNCTVDDLMTLKGLGEKKAIKIIEYREKNGLFSDIKDIMNVSGIGESTYNAIKDYIEV